MPILLPYVLKIQIKINVHPALKGSYILLSKQVYKQTDIMQI